jgi:hypothetical protein
LGATISHGGRERGKTKRLRWWRKEKEKRDMRDVGWEYGKVGDWWIMGFRGLNERLFDNNEKINKPKKRKRKKGKLKVVKMVISWFTAWNVGEIGWRYW